MKESVYLRTIDRKLTKNMGVFQGSALSACLYILPSKGANQLPLLFLRTLGNIQRNFLHLILFYRSWSIQMYPQYFAEVL